MNRQMIRVILVAVELDRWDCCVRHRIPERSVGRFVGSVDAIPESIRRLRIRTDEEWISGQMTDSARAAPGAS